MQHFLRTTSQRARAFASELCAVPPVLENFVVGKHFEPVANEVHFVVYSVHRRL